jgi:hypothetical protein
MNRTDTILKPFLCGWPILAAFGLETFFFYYCSQDSVAGIATGYGLVDQRVGIRVLVG